MAYVKINWNYGSVTYIRGFRIYEDGNLRGDVATNVREFIDIVDDIVGDKLRTVYTVMAYDEFGRESVECSSLSVTLTALLTPDMTGQTVPSGEAIAYVMSGPGTAGTGWYYFDRTNERIDWLHNTDIPSQEFEYHVTYEFLEPTVVAVWGWIEHIYYIGATAEDREYYPFELYGMNADESREFLGSIISNQDYTSGSRRAADVANPAAYKKYMVVFKGKWISANYSYIAKVGAILLEGTPQVS